MNMMDSGTAFLKAGSREEALLAIRKALEEEGGTVTEKGEELVLDFSNRFHRRIITARVEETSAPGQFAASFQEGSAPRCPAWLLPSFASIRRMRRILEKLTTS